MTTYAPHRTLRRAVLATVLLATVLIPVSMAEAQEPEAVPAAPPATGTVSGTVTDPGGDPVEGVWVTVGQYDDGASVETGADGTYEVEVLTGNHLVQFVPPEGSELAPQYWEARYHTPDPIRVVADGAVTGIDAQLEVGATVSGTVTAPPPHDVEGTTVYAYAWWDNPGFGMSAEVAADGTYTIVGVPPGNHVVAFEPDFDSGLVREYWDNSFSAKDAQLLHLELGEVVESIDASLSEGGGISGVVTDPLGDPLSDVYVEVAGIDQEVYEETFTDADGSYDIDGLAPGAYRVYFADFDSLLLPEYYDNVQSYDLATPVDVLDGAVTSDIDAQLDLGGSMSGRVTGLAGDPLPGVNVMLYRDSSEFPVAFGQTAATGRYTIGGLSPGEYTVAFSSPSGTQWYDHALVPSAATTVTIVDSANTPGINADFDRMVLGDDFTDNDTRVVAHCTAGDPSTFHFEVAGFDGTDGTTSGTVDFGDGTDFVFDSAGDMVDHTFAWPGGISTGTPTEVTVSLEGGPANTDSFTVITGWTQCQGGGAGPTFSDVGESHAFYAEIECLVDLGVTEGFPDGTFRPASDITRQALVAWLWRFAGEPEPSSLPEFSDVPEGHPFADAIAWATEAGIVNGYPDGTFRPGKLVTREAVAAFLWRFAGEPPADGVAHFSDVNPGMEFHEAIAWLQEQDVIAGFPDGTFRPGNDITRQAVAAWVCRFSDVALG